MTLPISENIPNSTTIEAMKEANELMAGKPLYDLPISDFLLENFGECFHTVLRKGMDSKFSIILWNATTAVEPIIWSGFVDYMVEKLTELKEKQTSISLQQFKAILEKWNDEVVLKKLYFSKDEDERDILESLKRHNRKSIIHIFTASINYFPDEELKQMMITIDEWSKI